MANTRSETKRFCRKLRVKLCVVGENAVFTETHLFRGILNLIYSFFKFWASALSIIGWCQKYEKGTIKCRACVPLKVQQHEIFCLWFFFMNRPHIGPWFIPFNNFEFWFELLEIFESAYLCFCPPASLSAAACQSACRPPICLPVCLSAYLFACVSTCRSVCLYVYPLECLSVCLPVRLPACLSVCLSICLSVCLSACLQ
jgi:hypothetical protein